MSEEWLDYGGYLGGKARWILSKWRSILPKWNQNSLMLEKQNIYSGTKGNSNKNIPINKPISKHKAQRQKKRQ